MTCSRLMAGHVGGLVSARSRGSDDQAPRAARHGAPTKPGGRDAAMSFLIGVLIFVVALLVSVMLHEAGHCVTAKAFGMKATQFFVGFGSTLWSTRRGETEYRIKALPLGGVVKITGISSIADVEPADQPPSVRAKAVWHSVSRL